MFLLAGVYTIISRDAENDLVPTGRWLEAYSKSRTADSITALGSLRPTEALLVVPRSLGNGFSGDFNADLEKGDPSLEDGFYPGTSTIEKIDARLLEVGDIVRVFGGSAPPCDGTVVAGEGIAFDESSLTGESRLVKKQLGDKVYVGTINKSNVVDIRVDALGSGTMSINFLQSLGHTLSDLLGSTRS
jgi:P-type Cu+ transporter